MSDLVKRLRKHAPQSNDGYLRGPALEAADRIEELEAECIMLAAGACIYPNGNGLLGDEHGNSFCGVDRERAALDLRETDLMSKVNELEAALREIKDLLSYAGQDACNKAVAQGNKNMAWHIAKKALDTA